MPVVQGTRLRPRLRVPVGRAGHPAAAARRKGESERAGSCFLGRRQPASTVRLASLYPAGPVLLFAGAAPAGFGFGAVSQGAVRAIVDSVPAREKSGTLASYDVLSHLAMSLPASPPASDCVRQHRPMPAAWPYGDRRSRDADHAAAQSAPDTAPGRPLRPGNEQLRIRLTRHTRSGHLRPRDP